MLNNLKIKFYKFIVIRLFGFMDMQHAADFLAWDKVYRFRRLIGNDTALSDMISKEEQ